MSTVATKTIVLIDHVNSGLPEPKHFRIESSQISTDPTSLAEGEIIVQSLVFSADPYLRGQIKSTGMIKPGQPVRGFIAGKVLASKNAGWVQGDLIGANLPFSTVQKVTDNELKATIVWKLTNFLNVENISQGIGVLGMPGSTAYGGLIDVLRPKEGETIFISAASGAVGQLVGQLAKQIYKCKVIGSVGGPDKVKLVIEKFGFDDAIDYKQCKDENDLIKAIKEKTNGEGIDMYFENVGGIHWDAALATLRPFGRVAVCGGIAEYNNETMAPQKIFPLKMIYTFQRIEGFVSRPWLSGAKGNFLKDMHTWLAEGKLKTEETFFDSIEEWPNAFQSLFTGKNKGKVVVRL